MGIKSFVKAMAAMAVSGMALAASANSIGFDQVVYDGQAGQISVTVNFDFTDFAMFGGGLDLIYDPNAVEFVSYTQGPLPPDADAPASPVGSLAAPGVYKGFGIGTFGGFSGITSTGQIGTFVFTVLGPSDATATPCDMTLCLQENGTNPFVSLAGQIVGGDLLAAGNSGADVVVPVPAAVWFILSGLGTLWGFGRKSAID